mgnify:FL=1
MSIQTKSKETKEQKTINQAVRSTFDYKIVELEWTSGTLYVDGIDHSYEVDLIKEAIQSVVGQYVVKDSCLRGTEKERWDQWAFDITDEDMPQRIYL